MPMGMGPMMGPMGPMGLDSFEVVSVCHKPFVVKNMTHVCGGLDQREGLD